MTKNIRIRNYKKILGGRAVLNGIDLELEKGSIIGVNGENGCGKTMLLRAICGLIKSDEGYVEIFGKRLDKEHPFPDSVGVMIEHTRFVGNINGMETLKRMTSIRRKVGEEQIRKTMRRVGLDPDDRHAVRKYSSSMRQRLAIAQAIMEENDLILLDEPVHALDTDGMQMTREILEEEQHRGATIVIASHDKGNISELCDYLVEMKNGRVIFDGKNEYIS